jgi:hypothetical protein
VLPQSARRQHHEPPDVEWLDPELELGADDGLPRLPELELPDELELDPPEFAELPPLPDDELPEEPEEVLPEEEAVELWPEPGRLRATAPATATLAMPTAAVVVWTRLRPRSRAATARATVSRFELLMACSVGGCSLRLLGAGSQSAMRR